MKRRFIASIPPYLILLLLSFSAFAGDHPMGRETHLAVNPVDETLLPVNPSRLSVLGRGLEFPFRHKKVIRDIKAYGIRPWGSEPVHNGIDLIVDNTGEQRQVGDKVVILSSVAGTVRGIVDFGGAGSILIGIEANPGLYVTYTFEPQTDIPSLRALQAASIDVTVGERVRRGQKLGDLVVGEGENGGTASGSGNPHIDTRLVLFDPDTLDPAAPFEDFITQDISHNDVANLPTFLCPYDYSTVRSKSAYEKVLANFDPDTQCTCPCRFPYNAAECGVGCID